MSSVKLVSLFIRTLAKPVSNQIKNRAKTHPKFREFCISVAQATHRIEMTWKLRVLGYKADAIRPLSDARYAGCHLLKTVDAGANFMGEAFIFSVAALVILAEQQRARYSARQQRDKVDDRLVKLEEETERLRELNNGLERRNRALESNFEELEGNLRVLHNVVSGILTKEMKNWSEVKEGRNVTKVIDKDILEMFERGENVDKLLAERQGIPLDGHLYFRRRMQEENAT
ncbi:hypothetical protein EV182_002134 [Spiromyces aspiralis]|uniref:Uncharacterized protein n=1 Tax=Spiromyces aspiralis TaxID=68401 RepID=A0ACC1HTN2_9FUNG|nr:hypothetical protein EV182_002134 [Spiromyces aspiralis]